MLMSGLLQIFAKESSLDLWSKASKNRDFLTVLYSVLLSALSGVCGSQLPFEGIEGVVVGTSRRPARSINRPPWYCRSGVKVLGEQHCDAVIVAGGPCI